MTLWEFFHTAILLQLLDRGHSLEPNQEKFDYDVIVLGAGPAGIGAATFLASNTSKLKILVLEARGRIGGRTHTINDFGYPIDCGAQWFHYCPNNNPIYRWAENIDGAHDHKLRVGNDTITILKSSCGEYNLKNWMEMLEHQDSELQIWRDAWRGKSILC